jgi:uridine phosphorylase
MAAVSDDERVTPQKTVQYAASYLGVSVDDFGVAPLVVVSWLSAIVSALVEAVGAEKSKYWLHGDRWPLYSSNVNGRPVSIAHVPAGASATVTQMEEMIACGARAFIGVGYAGSLQPHLPVGAFVVPTACVSEEGTSKHYVEDGANIAPCRRLAETLYDACREEGASVVTGPLWTTDAIYRELVTKINDYRQQGVLAVDMETSAMYALGRFRGVDVCNLLIVSDEVWDDWHMGFGTPVLRKAESTATRALVRCLADPRL